MFNLSLSILTLIHLFNVNYSDGCALVVNLISFILSTKHITFSYAHWPLDIVFSEDMSSCLG